jgi:mycothiol synthase
MPWKLWDRQIFLLRPDLKNVPELKLPEGYMELPNSDLLLNEWVSLLHKVFPAGGYTLDRVRPLVESSMWDVGRVKLVAREEQIVALSMAWHEPALWPFSGFVYWVAVLPEHRNRGLGTFALNRVLQHFANEGLRDAVTYTEEFRLPAIKMYLNSGFVPLITGTAQDERGRWQRAFDALGEPELMRTIREDYARIAGDKLKNSDIVEKR